MQKKYHLSTITHALLLAPTPILLGLFIYTLITEPSLLNNYENNSHFRFLITMTFGVYCIYVFFLLLPLLLILHLMNKYCRINFYTLILTAYTSTIVLSVLGEYFKNSHIPNTLTELKSLFIFNPLLIITGTTALSFWVYIKLFGKNDEKNKI